MRFIFELAQQLRATDELIDLIVYKLYGLSEEEIKIIEGRE
jgi:type II restriction/modification system DNA methylase subunit YeeA